MTVKFENTGFSVFYWKKHSEKDFIQLNLAYGIFKKYPLASRKTMLKQVYKIIRES